MCRKLSNYESYDLMQLKSNEWHAYRNSVWLDFSLSSNKDFIIMSAAGGLLGFRTTYTNVETSLHDIPLVDFCDLH